MQTTELLYGPIGRVFSSFSIIIILTLMTIVAVRLFTNRRQKAYLSLTISLFIILLQYVLMFILEINNNDVNLTTQYIIQFLKVISFILVNMGIYQLYNRSTGKEFTYFIGFIVTAVVITGIRFVVVSSADHPTDAFIKFHNIWLELYLLVLTFLCFYLVSPYIGQRIKYQIGITVYFFTEVAFIVNRFILSAERPFLSTLENFLPIVFYGILFILLFERVVELLQAIYNSAIKDGLTGLYNRPYLFNKVSQHIAQQAPITILFGDIDNFKKLNDSKGHQIGDKVLRQVADIIREEVDGFGMAGRYGGEELVALIWDPDVRIDQLAERIRKRVESETPTTISLGYSKYRKGVSGSELIKQADQAMYQAKQSGKNRVVPYTNRPVI